MQGFDAKAFLRTYLDDARALGKANELSWLDFKIEWHPMKTEEGKLEFVKDAAALANTGMHALLVVGVDDKTWALKDQRIASSGYEDASNFQSLIASRVTPMFSAEVEEMVYKDGASDRLLSLLHIPPTRNRPHLIGEWAAKGKPPGPGGPPWLPRSFKNALFFRRGARTFGPSSDEAPTRAELDAMYLDRPGVAAQLRVQDWREQKMEYARRHDPVLGREREMLSIPLVITNCSNLYTGVAAIRMKGRMFYVERAKAIAEAALLQQAMRSGIAVHPAYGELRLPLTLSPAQSVHVLCHFQISEEYWALPSVDSTGCHRLDATVEVEDIFGEVHYLATTFDDAERR